jgi:pseudouridine-5'-phosphate glycosidase
MNLHKYIEISPEIKKALAEQKPVVALESTIISHGMPYPQNAQTALMLEEIIRNKGAKPATIAFIKGKIKVGLNENEINGLAQAGHSAMKVSRRDAAFALAKKVYGSTTVSATMICADLAGIKVFVTGGIGGVHRGWESTLDISADLTELGRTNVLVLCAGPKAVLDIPATMEYLETMGVPVLAYQTDSLPAFYSRECGIKVHQRVDTPKEAAEIFKIHSMILKNQGMLLTCPVPEEFEIPSSLIAPVIESALNQAREKNITGRDITPFLLDKISGITDGASLKTNIELIKNNARIGAETAIELSGL